MDKDKIKVVIYADEESVNRVRENWPAFDIDGWIKSMIKIYEKRPFKNKKKNVFCQKIKSTILFHKIGGEKEVEEKPTKETTRKEATQKALELAGFEASEVFSRLGQAKSFIEKQPLFYDKSGLWWIWDFENNRYDLIDEIDLLNSITKTLGIDTVNSKARTEILNSLKQVGRKSIPKVSGGSWIQFKDRIIDVERWKQFKATPKYFVTNPIPYQLGESEDTPEIDKLFISWVGEEHIKELYEIIAFTLIPSYFIHRIICLIGSGSNGKGTYQRIIKKFVGENITSSSLERLTDGRFEGAKLYKKLICFMGETNFNSIKKTDFIKSATGEDVIGGEFKNKNPFDFVNYAKFIVATNCLPVTEDKTIGFYRRWKIIDFPNQFEVEKDVLDKIPGKEYENLARKCLMIARGLWKDRTFTNDGNFEDRRKVYEEKSNPLMAFIQNDYIEDINGETLYSTFYTNFKQHLANIGHRDISSIGTSKLLKNEGYEIKTLPLEIKQHEGSKKYSTAKHICGLKSKLGGGNGEF